MKYLEQIRQYWDSRSEGYRLQIEKELDGHHEETYLRYFSQIPQGSSVLDIGCGPGYFSLLLSSLGMKVTAADYSEKMLEQAKICLTAPLLKMSNLSRQMPNAYLLKTILLMRLSAGT